MSVKIPLEPDEEPEPLRNKDNDCSLRKNSISDYKSEVWPVNKKHTQTSQHRLVRQIPQQGQYKMPGNSGKGNVNFFVNNHETNDTTVLKRTTQSSQRSSVIKAKMRTFCRACGHRGHWEGDACCPLSGNSPGGRILLKSPTLADWFQEIF